VKQDLEKAANYFFKAINAGYFKAKKNLDKIYRFTKKFKEKHPNYRTLEHPRQYQCYEEQPVEFVSAFV